MREYQKIALQFLRPGKQFTSSDLMHAVLDLYYGHDPSRMALFYSYLRQWSLRAEYGISDMRGTRMVRMHYPDEFRQATEWARRKLDYVAAVADAFHALYTSVSSLVENERRAVVAVDRDQKAREQYPRSYPRERIGKVRTFYRSAIHYHP